MTLVAGEVEEVRFVLPPLALEEPHVLTIPKTAYVFFGESFLDIASHELAGDTACDPCHFYLQVPPNATAGRVEVTWTATTVSPALNDDLFWLMCKNPANSTTTKYRCGDSGQPGTGVGSGYIKQRGGASCCSEEQMKNTTRLRFDVHAGVSVAYELRANVWLSFAYLDPFPDGFTALPPT